MKTLKQLANIGAKAAALLNTGCGTLAVTRNHPGWFHDEEQRQAFAQAVKEAVLAELVTKPDSSPTPRTDKHREYREDFERCDPNFARQLERENAEMLGVLESILPYIEGDTKVPWKPALAVITTAKGVQP